MIPFRLVRVIVESRYFSLVECICLLIICIIDLVVYVRQVLLFGLIAHPSGHRLVGGGVGSNQWTRALQWLVAGELLGSFHARGLCEFVSAEDRLADVAVEVGIRATCSVIGRLSQVPVVGGR